MLLKKVLAVEPSTGSLWILKFHTEETCLGQQLLCLASFSCGGECAGVEVETDEWLRLRGSGPRV
jgi:hypothetical protein